MRHEAYSQGMIVCNSNSYTIPSYLLTYLRTYLSAILVLAGNGVGYVSLEIDAAHHHPCVPGKTSMTAVH